VKAVQLTCEKLINFDLIENLEKNLDTKVLLEFFQISSDINNIDSFIRESPSFPGSTDKIIRNELISVIGATLSIEGTILEKEEIEESIQKAERGQILKRKEQEAENSRKVYRFLQEFVLNHKDGFEYTEALINQIHKYFTDSIDYLSNVPGEYRRFNVTFGYPRKNSLCKTQSDIELAMKNFVIWLNSEGNGLLSKNHFVKAIMAHYYLTEIHPFTDGNGRTARALEALILYANRVNDYCFWSLSNFWSSHKDKYLSHLHDIRQTEDPISFLLWGLEGYRDEISGIKNKVLKKVKQLMFSDYIQYLLRNKKNERIKINQRIVNVLQLIMLKGRTPLKKFIDSPEMIALYSDSARTTRIRDFQKMEALALIKSDEIDNEVYIEPNYRILEYLTYNV
jgi:Fic family protein